MEHTKLPWVASEDINGCYQHIGPADWNGGAIASVYVREWKTRNAPKRKEDWQDTREGKANLNFILTACNNFEAVCAERDELRAIAQELSDWENDPKRFVCPGTPCGNIADIAQRAAPHSPKRGGRNDT